MTIFSRARCDTVFRIVFAAVLLIRLSSCGRGGDDGTEPPPPARKDGWTWISGSINADQAGRYGTKGLANPQNAPGGRHSAVSWLDPKGNFWLFGGQSMAAPEHYSGTQNDLWKYDPAANVWAWISGDDSPGLPGVYGTKGVASPNNVPGSREDAASWSDTNGRLWLFGGWGPDAEGHWGYLNDLWRFDTTTEDWTWVSGSDAYSQRGVYGTKGVAAPENVPGGRVPAVSWIDSNGKLWLFGGVGYDSIGETSGGLNDMWRFDPRTMEWVWVSGDVFSGRPATYGIKGVTLPSNDPGMIGGAVAWIDPEDNLWLFGGSGMTGNGLNALWKFDTTSLQWTWISGSDFPDQMGSYGTKGVASASNVPGARINALAWPGASGEFWLFGGQGYSDTDRGSLNDLWKFDPASREWTWMGGTSDINQAGLYGTKGGAGLMNLPGGRSGSVVWKNAAQGELWLLGGDGWDRTGDDGKLNDLWRFSSVGPAIPPSTAVRVTLAPDAASVDRTESVQFHAMAHNSSDDRVAWSLSGAGCSGDACGTLSDSGLYTAPENTPDPPTVTVTATSVADPSKSASATVTIVDAAVVVTLTPGSADIYVGESVLFRASVEHATDHDVTWSLFGAGCSGAGCGTLSDSGLYTAPQSVPNPAAVTVTATSVADPSKSAGVTVTILEAVTDQWAWISGSRAENAGPFYGQRGVADPANVPGSREGAAAWTDLAGRLWLFGGGSDVPGYQGAYNDLWMYDPATREWTWIFGNTLVNRTGSYGTIGVPDPSNVPGSRVRPVTWTDPGGDLWLFGGFGRGIDPNTAGELSDLWRYELATGEWTWVSGNRGLYWGGYYGTKGIADSSNKPGARFDAVSWTDEDGNLWLFGGQGYDSSGQPGWLNDLWKYNIATNEWTWESGSDRRGAFGVYGTKGEPGPENVPGGRLSAVAWIDPQGRLWLFGGTGNDAADNAGRLNDLWMFDPASRQWTWMSGSGVRGQLGIYGTRGVSAPANVPGGRWMAVSWPDNEGRMWLFGGLGLDAFIAGDRKLNDLWRFDPATLEWTWMSGSDSGDQGGIYGNMASPT
jgi:N-acetylneuraminic acid mutarotase